MWEKTREVLLESLERMQHTLARIIPALAVLMVTLALAVVLAVVARVTLRRICTRVELDRRVLEWGLAARGKEHLAARWVERIGAWSVLAVGLLVGLSAFDAGATSSLSVRLIEYLPHVLVAVVIVVAGLAIARTLERAILIGAVNLGLRSARLLGVAARWLVVITALAMGMEHVGVGGSVLPLAFGILFGGIVLALALAIGLGARDTVARSLERRFGQREEAAAEEDEEKEDLRHM